MVASNFKQALHYVLTSEGGNDDDPQDHGGRTSRGITQKEYDAWLLEQNRPHADVWAAPQADIETIYHNEYWNPYCDALASGVDYMFFNTCVLAGPDRAIRLLQLSLGVTADGRLGPVTRRALGTISPRTLIMRFTANSNQFYHNLHQPRFLKGWLNRNQAMQANAFLMLT